MDALMPAVRDTDEMVNRYSLSTTVFQSLYQPSQPSSL